ncbi:MAG: hypothetical protein HN413_07925 [Chloroflexi bacterium]|jgi:hypothetical protein|nr:hypothetical protein [Chloroflexota bacterium]
MNKSIYEKASDELHGLCDGSSRFTMSVPVRNDDSDIVISIALELSKVLAKKIKEHQNAYERQEQNRIMSEARDLADAYLSANYLAEQMRTPLDFDPGDIVLGGHTCIKYLPHVS